MRRERFEAIASAVLAFLLSIPLSFASIYLSAAIFILIPLMYFLLPRRFTE